MTIIKSRKTIAKSLQRDGQLFPRSFREKNHFREIEIVEICLVFQILCHSSLTVETSLTLCRHFPMKIVKV